MNLYLAKLGKWPGNKEFYVVAKSYSEAEMLVSKEAKHYCDIQELKLVCKNASLIVGK